MLRFSRWRVVVTCLLLGGLGASLGSAHADTAVVAPEDRIRPYAENPYFWQYKGEPVLLLGGSWQDNLFNHPEGLEEHLDRLVSVGGNYLRNTMSSRTNGTEAMTPTLEDMESGAMDAHVLDYPWAFARDEATGLYNLDEMGEEYWDRFTRFLELTAERDIIVQIEFYDRFDYARLPWQYNPFNPRLNSNYSAEESGLPEFIDTHPGLRENPFFRTVPALENNPVVLPYQEAFIGKLLSISLNYGHVLYCVSNETNESPEWGAYWARFVRDAAEEAGVEAHVTEMWGPSNLTHHDHRNTIDHPELYTYVDVSQNNGSSGWGHWNDLQYIRGLLAERPRPINNVKLYTFNSSHDAAIERWWHNVLGGAASTRFHRPHPLEGGVSDHEKETNVGLGLSPLAQTNIRSARTLIEKLDWPHVAPDISFFKQPGDLPPMARPEKTHVAYTRDASGQARLYVNGELVKDMEVGGDFSNWDTAYRLALGMELSGERPWLGVYHAVRIYDQALSEAAIAALGADASTTSEVAPLVYYDFAAGDGDRVLDRSGRQPALDLQIADPEAVTWQADGLAVNAGVLMATEMAPQRLMDALQASNALTLEAWITPANDTQAGPARIITLSANTSQRNVTLGQDGAGYQVRLRSTATNGNGLPALETQAGNDATLVGMRSLAGDRAAVFMRGAPRVILDHGILREGLRAQWLNPRDASWQDAEARPEGYYQPPNNDFWLLVLSPAE